MAVTNDKTFHVEIDTQGLGVFVYSSGHDRLSEAAKAMETLSNDNGIAAVRIRNNDTDVVIDESTNDDFNDANDNDFDDDLTYSIVGTNSPNSRTTLESDFDDVVDAIREAFEYSGYDTIEIIDSNGILVKTIS